MKEGNGKKTVNGIVSEARREPLTGPANVQATSKRKQTNVSRQRINLREKCVEVPEAGSLLGQSGIHLQMRW